MMSPADVADTRPEITSAIRPRKRPAHRFGNKRYLVGKYQGSPHASKPPRPERRTDLTRPISRKTLRVVSVPNRPTYPLNIPLNLRVIEWRGTVIVQPTDLRDCEELEASGRDLRGAMWDFGRRFDHWARKNRGIPPHLRTEQNERVVRILSRVVDWDRYERENPLVQPMWGRILERRPDGALRIFWVIGPQDAQNQEAILRPRDIVPALGEIPPGGWFYGTARCFPDRVVWDEDPAPAPDPEDEEARSTLWAQLPVEYANEPDAWPSSPG